MSKRLALLAAVICALVAQQAPAFADDPPRLTVTQLDARGFPDVRLVVRVTDAAGRAVKGLGNGDVDVYEKGVPQQAKLDLASEVAPVRLVVALDISGSMAGQPLSEAKGAITSLIDALGPRDSGALITFNHIARIVQPLTGDKNTLVAATQRAVAGGNTAIYDAVALGLDILRPLPTTDRRAIVLLTDGEDTASATARDSVAQQAGQLGIPIYAVGFGNAIDRPTLQALADRSSNGRAFVAPNATELRAIYNGLAELIRTEYSITYRSNARQAPDGAPMDVVVRLRRDGRQIAETSATFKVPSGRGVIAQTTPAPPPPSTTKVAQTDGRGVPISSPLIGVLGGISVAILLFAIYQLARLMPGRQRRRLEIFVRGLALTPPEHAKRRSIVQRVIVPSFRIVGKPFMRVTPTALIESTRQRLQNAGEPMGLGPVELLGLQFGGALAGVIVGLFLAPVTRSDFVQSILTVGVAGLIGYVTPSVIVDILARRRKDAIRKALPGSLDMLALSVEAGLSLDGAFAQVAHRWLTPLSEEFRSVLLEFQMGRDRRQALLDMAARTGLPDVMRFVTAVVQADMLGVPLSRVLFEQAADMRLRRRQRAEDLARKAPVKMLFPMVVLIFPALFVVILGPAIPRLTSLFELTY